MMLHADRPMQKMSSYIELIQQGEHFYMPKILHGFWEKLLFHCNLIGSKDMNDLLNFFARASGDSEWIGRDYDIDHRKSIYYKPRFDWYYEHLLQLIRTPREGLTLGVDYRGFPGDCNPLFNRYDMLRLIHDCVPRECPTHNGLFWKDSVIRGTVFDFWNELLDRDVVFVGLDHLLGVGESIGLRRCHYIVVEKPIGLCMMNTMREIRKMHHRLGGNQFYIFQLGGSASAYMIFRCYGMQKSTFIDMGRSLDAWTDVGISQAWYQEIPQDVRDRIRISSTR